ncbi:MAG: type VII toxin-antitoxin system HepT family RNase toxin [Caulobacteraceae bacterium]
MPDNAVICRKIGALVNYYKEFKEFTDKLDYAAYKSDIIRKRAIERDIQLIVECATDINNMILKSLKVGPSKDYFNSFVELAENNILEMEFALKIAPSTGLRNILVHEYQAIDDKIVFASINKILEYYHEYINKVSSYLQCK